MCEREKDETERVTPKTVRNKLAMKKTIILILILLVNVPLHFAQQREDDYTLIKRNVVFVEGSVYHAYHYSFVSINYELSLLKRRNMLLRTGFIPDFSGDKVFHFPLTLAWLSTPVRKHHLELGVGLSFRLEHVGNIPDYDPPKKNWNFYPMELMIPMMYRYQKSSGFMLRAGLNAFITWGSSLSPSLSMGYKF